MNAELQARALEVHRILCETYCCPIPTFAGDAPMDELVSSFLNHRTKNPDARRAFAALKARYPTYDAVLEADPAELEATIHGVTWPEQKAPRLQLILQAVKNDTGGFSLDFLADLPPAQARAWLERLPGVGPKTSAAVLSFSRLRMRALPVDSHHFRVAARLGLISQKTSLVAAHQILEEWLPEEWGFQEVFDHHQLFMRHGKRICTHLAPKCPQCPVLALCPTGQARLGMAA